MGAASQGQVASRWTIIDSPVGDLLLTAHEDRLTGIYFRDHRGGADARADQNKAGRRADDDLLLARTAHQLQEYFAGERRDFDLPLGGVGTDFQQRVWAQLLTIGYGETASYGDVAAALGMPPGASRAVGLANGSNPISIVVPCHRVIGANGSLTGYGGGLERKQFLLDLESDALF